MHPDRRRSRRARHRPRPPRADPGRPGRSRYQAKYLYTIPSVQNPSGGVAPLERRHRLLELAKRHELPIFEDDCYADLTWSGERPTTLRGLDDGGRVIYCGTFSKTIAPALRVGYIVADWPVMSRLLSVKYDGGSGALEQMVLAQYAGAVYDEHVTELAATLEKKCDAMLAAVRRHFGPVAQVSRPQGGIFIWITLPESVDTAALAQAALREGIAINPGADWSTNPEDGRHKFRLCFGGATIAEIEAGVQKLAEVYRREYPSQDALAA
ncbi:MAG: PLP-dependent aminotransferase family protein [Burkholderiaceae bacterium]